MADAVVTIGVFYALLACMVWFVMAVLEWAYSSDPRGRRVR